MSRTYIVYLLALAYPTYLLVKEALGIAVVVTQVVCSNVKL